MNTVLGIIHFHWLQQTKPDLEELVTKAFRIEEIAEARNMLAEHIGKEKLPKKWAKTRHSKEKYFEDIHDIFSAADFEVEELQVFVSSFDLKVVSTLVNFPGETVDPSDVVPVSTRLGQLEGMVKNLSEGFKDFKNEAVKRWNKEEQRDEAGARGGAGASRGEGGSGASVGSGAENRAGEVGVLGDFGVRSGAREPYSTAAKRGRRVKPPTSGAVLPVGHWDRQQTEAQEQNQEQGRQQVDEGWQQQNKNRNRNRNPVKYGTGKIVLAGAEAAPICIHIGNVNPEATEDMVKKAIVDCANSLQEKPEELKEEQVKVEMVRRREEDPNPRTRAWKLTVPNLWREVVVERSDFYPRGWSHRQWFNRSNYKKKDEQAGPRGTRGQPGGPLRLEEQSGRPRAGEEQSGGPRVVQEQSGGLRGAEEPREATTMGVNGSDM